MSILTFQEAADALRAVSPNDYPQLNIILPFVDDFIQNSTGRDWSSDAIIDPTAKMIASVLVVRWFDNPGQIGEELKPTDLLVSLIGQLHSKALVMT